MDALVYVPRDASAISLGADTVAGAIAAAAARCGRPVKIVRNGSRGMYSHEPMVEAVTPSGRVAYGPVSTADVGALFEADFLNGGAHRLRLGVAENIPWLKSQTRLTFSRVGVIDPASPDDYIAHEGHRGLDRALTMAPDEIVAELTKSELRGRGGAGFPAGIKWKTALDARADQKYIVCNADEGDSGTFSDRMIMEGDPFALIEGMTIAALAVGATRGYIYLRSEYPHARRTLATALAAAHAKGWLGAKISGSRNAFDIELRIGAGAYICGEETAMLESIEGKRGMVRYKPPIPAVEGLFGKPTIVNNVITLATVPVIFDRGAESYAATGTGKSRGTLPFQIAGNAKRPGLVEAPLGITIREIVDGYGGGTASDRPIRAVQVGGPLGAYFPASMLDTLLDYESMAAHGGILGHGGIVVFDDTVNMAQMARYAMEFCAIESCGKCTPCRIGSVRGTEVIDDIIARRRSTENLSLLRDLCDTMKLGSLCQLGGLVPLPVLSGLKYFPDDFGLTAADVEFIGPDLAINTAGAAKSDAIAG
ncbi:MAG TPA: NADH-ubiquinone oxidoreductase-F iron-sulfur binding region domain-containing protein [Candidatus Binataceae bacterium]|nr:NADH-ubiquinone oxidoreductase-F iron-sulfur binding region domain-containing protein [Candidatus Binataceae bacterium]